MTHDAQITLFLRALKESVAADRFRVVEREKNNLFLAENGMTPIERRNIILSLEVVDYVSGPEIDLDYPEEKAIWKFRKRYLDMDIYIKIKLVTLKNEDIFYAKCISFHN